MILDPDMAEEALRKKTLQKDKERHGIKLSTGEEILPMKKWWNVPNQKIEKYSEPETLGYLARLPWLIYECKLKPKY